MAVSAYRVADRALTVGALLGLVALLSAALGAALGVRPLFLRSGSMAPTIDTGSLALARNVSAGDLRVGDVVTVTTSSGARVTHRIVRAEREADQVVLTLRGDANRANDAETYPVRSAYRVFWHVPGLGYAAALSSSLGLVLVLLVAGLLVLTGRRRGSDPPPAGGRRVRPTPAHRSRKRRRARTAGAVSIAAVAAVAGPAGPATAAPWTDNVVVSGTTLTAGTVPAPTLSCGGLGVLSVTFNWTAVSGATDYTLHYGSGGATTVTVTGTTRTITTAISSGTAWVVANHNYGSVTWSSVASNTRTYTVAVVSLCS